MSNPWWEKAGQEEPWQRADPWKARPKDRPDLEATWYLCHWVEGSSIAIVGILQRTPLMGWAFALRERWAGAHFHDTGIWLCTLDEAKGRAMREWELADAIVRLGGA